LNDDNLHSRIAEAPNEMRPLESMCADEIDHYDRGVEMAQRDDATGTLVFVSPTILILALI